MEKVMIRINSNCGKSQRFTARRVTLLASVAALGATVLLAGSAGYWQSAGVVPANAAEFGMQRPVGFADIVAKVKPAVISVRVKVSGAAEPAMLGDNSDDGEQQIPVQPGSPLDKFFRQFGQEFGPHAPRRHGAITGVGSGFFITADGYAVTNNHVVDHATSVQVTTDDGTVYAAKVVGTDPKTDLALIKVDGNKDFPFVKFAEHAPQVGDWVVAVGNPFGLGGTVTAGIVSARGRDIGAGPYDDYVQIDAPINKGNSGGPAFKLCAAGHRRCALRAPKWANRFLPPRGREDSQITEHSANRWPVLLSSDGMSAFMIQQWVKNRAGVQMLKTFAMCETDFAKLKKIHSEKQARLNQRLARAIGIKTDAKGSKPMPTTILSGRNNGCGQFIGF
jgi:hypothetical protein